MIVTIFDYGAGNLHSLRKALETPATRVAIESDPARCRDAEVLVLPGVGSFAQAARCLAPAREELRDAIRAGLPTVGICLGMQLLFPASEEGEGEGLGILDGAVTRLDADRVPQIGWNAVEGDADPLIRASGLTTAYYANGFVCRPSDESTVTAWSTHERDRFPAIVRRYRALGVQFHPEKSSTAGVRFLRAAVAEVSA
jgi:glutamine amidotransferase